MKFYEDVRNILGARIVGFDLIFDYLRSIDNPLIVETGCARVPDNYTGDGESSLLFDEYINEYGGEFYTVDISSESVSYCRSKMKSRNSHVIQEDSITYLKQLNQELLTSGRKIDFLYLDSFDAPRHDPAVLFTSAKHHLYELMTILPSLKPGAIIGVDDNWFENNQFDGKGKFVFDYMNSINNNPLLLDYQIFWKW
jgi:hypothetical protein